MQGGRVIERTAGLPETRRFPSVGRQHFARIFRIRIPWRFQNMRNMGKFRKVNQIVERFESDFTFPDIGVAIFRCALFVFAVVDVKDRDLIQTQDPVELREHFVRILSDIIARIVGVAGIEADPKAMVLRNAVINGSQLLEAAPEL